ncbi:Hypothetical protein KVN_LOCUS480 [uncultured virus]|nr:Hypothetical protein KVN_LOCUS480 [uncultured virus]
MNKSNNQNSNQKKPPTKTTRSEFSGNKSAPILCNDFDIKRFKFTELDTKNVRSKAQWISYPRYDYPGRGETNFMFQTPEFNITQYGLPRKDPEGFYKEDNQRNFIKVPLDPTQEGCKTLEKMLLKIDEYVEKNKKTILGKSYHLFTYQPIVREPSDPNDLEQIGDDDDATDKPTETKTEPSKEKYKYCKMKLNISFETQEILTTVYVKGTDGNVNLVQVKSATDLDQYHNFLSKVRYIVTANKLWASKNKNESGIRKFGVALKILQMELVPSEKGSSSIREMFTKYAFQNNDEPVQETQGGEESNNNKELDNNDNEEMVVEEANNNSEDEIVGENQSDEAVQEEQSDPEDENNEDSSDSGESEEEQVVPIKKEPVKKTTAPVKNNKRQVK